MPKRKKKKKQNTTWYIHREYGAGKMRSEGTELFGSELKHFYGSKRQVKEMTVPSSYFFFLLIAGYAWTFLHITDGRGKDSNFLQCSQWDLLWQSRIHGDTDPVDQSI